MPDPRYETGGKPLTNNVIGRRRLIDVGAKQQNSIGKIVPFLLHRFLDWILLLLLRQSPPYGMILAFSTKMTGDFTHGHVVQFRFFAEYPYDTMTFLCCSVNLSD